ncbi:MAG: hypothetical protein PWP08_36 [Methanofollis sp.]|nr:hypothetical protein [Methanofollis sp.]
MDLLPVGICIIDEGLKVRYWNTCLEEWTGMPTADMLGQDLTEHFPGLKKSGVIERIRQVLQGGAPAVFSSQIHICLIPSYFPDGTMRVQRTTLIPLNTGSEGHFNAMFVCEDVSALTEQVKSVRAMRNQTLHELEERRKAELALIAAHEDLRTYLAENTSRLRNSLNNAADDLKMIRQEMEAGDRDGVGTKLRDVIVTIESIEKRLSELNEAARERQREIRRAPPYFIPEPRDDGSTNRR